MTGFANFEEWTPQRELKKGRALIALSGLYLRSRSAGYAAGCIVAVAVCTWGLGSWLLSLPDITVNSVRFLYVLVLSPVLVACVVGASAHSTIGETEQTSARPLPPLRLGHFAGLIALAALALTSAALAWDLDGKGLYRTVLTLLRNVGGFTGLVLLVALVVDGRLSWVFPLTFSVYALIRGLNPDGTWVQWAWPMRPVTDELSWANSLGLLAVGLVLVCTLGPRKSAQEPELGDG
ncbi:hypothetical protein BH23ACT11_BH23ACT11_19090 [soil metagenome]